MASSMSISSVTNLCLTHINKHPFLSFPVSIYVPTTKLSLQLCVAAKSQTGPVKMANNGKKKKGKNENENPNSKSKSNLNSVKEVNWSDVDIVDDDESSSDASFGYPSTPLPKLPAGYVVDDTGRVLMASNKRIATIVAVFPVTADFCFSEIDIIASEDEEYIEKGSHPVLLIESKGHALHVFVNQELQGTAFGNGTHPPFKFKNPIPLKAGKNEIALLSMTVGLQVNYLSLLKCHLFQNAGSFYEWMGAGLTSVKINGFNNGALDLAKYNWTYKIGLPGEHLGIYKLDGLNGVNWVSTSEPPNKQPLTWYKAVVSPPSGDESVGLDMLEMGKGLAWLNGEEIGRYWQMKSSAQLVCVQECDYRGKFFPDKSLTGCGQPTQRCFGTPTGTCGSYSIGDCHDPNSTAVVEKVCLSENECAIELTEENFDKGLCPGATKKLVVEVACSLTTNSNREKIQFHNT